MKYEFIDLPWDTEYFGKKSGKIILNEELGMKELEEIIKITETYEFVTINNINNSAINNNLIGRYTNSFLVDINVQFEMKVKNINQKNYFEAKSCLEESSEILKIAKNSFNYSRFYNDPYLDKNLSNQIYHKWVKNSFNKKEKYFIIAQEKDEIFGYLLFSFNDSDALTIELISLDKLAQGKGIGTKLLVSLLNFSRNNNIHKIKVGTQMDNLQAINFYLKKGFSLTSKSSIYHLWPREEF